MTPLRKLARSGFVIEPYKFQGLEGRYAFYPALNKRSQRTFLLVYGQHASIERCLAVMEALAHYGDVYLVDTPGFGGMQPAYVIKRYPNLHFYAEHLKHVFDSVLPPNKIITPFGISYGWQIITQFLADYPSYQRRIDTAISFVGLVSPRDFRLSPGLRFTVKYLASAPGKTWAGSKVYQHLILRDRVLRTFYYFYSMRNPRFIGINPKERKELVKEQSWLWRHNDPRTHAATAWDFLCNNDLTKLRIDMPIVHMGVPDDHFLNNELVVRELKMMFTDVKAYNLNLTSHAPVSFDSADKILDIIPNELHNNLKKPPKSFK